ncbi:NAD-dependent epimerase/dehydratase family protein [Candidatus Galacturonibacter soehngenii]|uniref:NAD-dependent epimerase/dehydratase family protein n=1 Tax=Candidatus Galacturonatibacter soehngenii TaxID=2307010 RepID=A0A7V7QKD4_9FIRM|nr:NAD-dependent epimerase/dehydratase family protein [Candidatus Galacturonibacter soehngenii]KAB1438252.1 NAD-dependent epimerase/dehydratase family protein [Candidatus Galacturonibacter soehngenii]
MLLDNAKYKEQIDSVVKQGGLSLEKLKESSFMITGAAGMLGSGLVDMLIYLNEVYQYNIKIFALGRTASKLRDRFGEYVDRKYFNLINFDLSKELHLDQDVDYIIHAASNADPYMMANYPVDTLLTNVVGMNNVLDLARRKKSRRVLYVSSGEMYGQPDDTLSNGFHEEYCGVVDYSNPRSCYPSGKRAAEVLCQSYITQYDVDVVIVRPCHCYGPTMTSSDSRAMSQFFRKVLQGEDIVLKSDGSLERSHCYVLDAVNAMMYVLLEGEKGEAYNIADSESNASIKTIATLIAQQKQKSVVFDIPSDIEKQGFSKVVKAVLNSNKLMNIGWFPLIHLDEGIRSTLKILEDTEEM